MRWCRRRPTLITVTMPAMRTRAAPTPSVWSTISTVGWSLRRTTASKRRWPAGSFRSSSRSSWAAPGPNGPQGGLAFDLEALDNVQFGQPQVPPAPGIASDQSATEMVEHYWASLLRDVAFDDYGSSPVAASAAAELGSQ